MTKPDFAILPSAYGMVFPLAGSPATSTRWGFLTLAGLFVGHMSGNTVRLGVFVGGGDWSLAAQRLVPIVVFTLGVVVGIALCEALGRRSVPVTARVLGIEAVLLLVFMLVGRAVLGSDSAPAGSWDYYLLVTVVVLAMGLQNVALRRAAGLPIHTTFVTFRRARLHGGVWLSYLVGGILGAFIALHWDLWSLTLPLAVLVALIAFDLLRRG